MRTVVEHLSDEAVEPDSPDYPGLAGLAALLVEDRYLKHKDKEVRLHTVLACVEIFYMVSFSKDKYSRIHSCIAHMMSFTIH
jgi:hypothetical protein